MRNLIVSIVIILAVLFVTGIQSQGEEDVIHGCYKKKNGQLRIVKKNKKCRKSETPISWNQTGPQGEQGPPGANAPELTNALCELYALTSSPKPAICPELPGHIVFVTSTIHTGNLDGVAGADSICQERAAEAGLSGTFKAWISDDTTDPDSSFIHHTDEYILTTGEIVANNWDDLTDGLLSQSIDRDEYGCLVDPQRVWTGTLSNGTPPALPNNCDNWTVDDFTTTGLFGVTHQASEAWSKGELIQCSYYLRLYCFQQ